jgi:HTH-type transcriptional regulator, sugar sensing transcriptional regulator
MEIVPALQRLGFAEYEARAYLALVKQSPLNGYELAKASGIPRANVYAVLDRLAARGAVLRLDEPAGVRYAPVPPAELLARLGGEFQTIAEAASRELSALEAAREREPVWNVQGYDALLDQARTAVSAATGSLLVAVYPDEAAALRAEVADADARGVAITTLCMAACERECGGCRGEVHRYRTTASTARRRLIVVPDDADVVAGEIGSDGDAQCVRTRQPLLVDICSSSVRSAIALAELGLPQPNRR